MDSLQSILLISFGSVLGANLRVNILNHSSFFAIKRYWLNSIINIFASFCLGYLVSFLSDMSNIRLSDSIFLFASIGFLGGLSSFSTLIFELFDFLRLGNLYSFIYLLFVSLSLGVFATYVGFLLGAL